MAIGQASASPLLRSVSAAASKAIVGALAIAGAGYLVIKAHGIAATGIVPRTS